jgi:antitoxin component of MazEF toxin-antitoxin module
MKEFRKEFKRSVINLGNSKAITFPGEWVEKSKLKEKTEVTLFPIDEKTIVVRTGEKDQEKTTYRLVADKIPLKLVRQAIISAFKLNVDQIYLKYNEDNREKLYEILVDLRREIIGFDFKDISEDQEYYINFLLDASKTTYREVLEDLIVVFNAVIEKVVTGNGNNNIELLLDEVDRKYSLGTRILITGLSEYPFSRSNLPVINFLGDRVVLLLVRDFINEAIYLQEVPKMDRKRYANVLLKIPNLLKQLIENYHDLDLKIISNFQKNLTKIEDLTTEIQEESEGANKPIKNIITYYLNNFKNLFDIGITRMIESEIGIF